MHELGVIVIAERLEVLGGGRQTVVSSKKNKLQNYRVLSKESEYLPLRRMGIEHDVL